MVSIICYRKILDPEEGSYSSFHISQQKQRQKEVTLNNQDKSKYIEVYGKNLKSTVGKDIEIESSVVTYETSDTEGDKDNCFLQFRWQSWIPKETKTSSWQ